MNLTFVSLRIALAAALLCCAPPASSYAALVYSYDAGDDGDGNYTNNTWQATIETAASRDWALDSVTGTTITHVTLTSAETDRPGLTGAYRWGVGAGPATTTTYGATSLPLGGTNSDAVGASASFELWIKPNLANWDTSNSYVVFETGGGTNGLVIALDTNGTSTNVLFRTRNSSNIETTITLSGTQYLDDFIQIVGVVDSEAGSPQIALFINGGMLAGGTQSSVSSYKNWQAGTGGAGLGNANGPFAGSLTSTMATFNGDIAILNIYNTALSATQVQSAYNAIAVPEPSGFALAGIALISGLALLCRRRSREIL